jgi:hypothetical protein
MKRRVKVRLALAAIAAASGAIAFAMGCGTTGGQTGGGGDGQDAGGQGDQDGGGGNGSTNGSSSGNTAGGFTPGDACTNLECFQVTCTNSNDTTQLQGTVYDPAGKVPLYNVLVYVPNEPLQPLTDGVSCDRCGSVSGHPIASAITDAQGHFQLDNVPAGIAFPLVMQVGKWRRMVTVPAVTACQPTSITDKEQTRLPKSSSEGDLPRIALATGAADPLECLMRKIGIEDGEFTTAGGGGRIHLYKGGGYTKPDGGVVEAGAKFAPTLNDGGDYAAAPPFWGDIDKLKQYDVVLLACEGAADAFEKPDAAKAALYSYTQQGGRVFASHWHREWFEHGPAPLPTIASWTYLPDPPNPLYSTIVTSFPKGSALHDWLNYQNLLDGGKLPIHEAKQSITAATDGVSQAWLTATNTNAADASAVQYLTFNSPIGVEPASQCGRVVFSDLHVSSGDAPGEPFPSGCTVPDLSAQERALEFMLFDLSGCLQADNTPPAPPR